MSQADSAGDLVGGADQQAVIGLLRGVATVVDGGDRHPGPAGQDQQHQRSGQAPDQRWRVALTGALSRALRGDRPLRRR